MNMQFQANKQMQFINQNSEIPKFKIEQPNPIAARINREREQITNQDHQNIDQSGSKEVEEGRGGVHRARNRWNEHRRVNSRRGRGGRRGCSKEVGGGEVEIGRCPLKIPWLKKEKKNLEYR